MFRCSPLRICAKLTVFRYPPSWICAKLSVFGCPPSRMCTKLSVFRCPPRLRAQNGSRFSDIPVVGAYRIRPPAVPAGDEQENTARLRESRMEEGHFEARLAAIYDHEASPRPHSSLMLGIDAAKKSPSLATTERQFKHLERPTFASI